MSAAITIDKMNHQAAFEDGKKLELIRGGTNEKIELSDELLGTALNTLDLLPGSKILEFGCGTGTLIRQHLIPYSEKNNNTISITGLDVSQSMIDFAIENSSHGNVTYLCGDAQDTRLESNSYDLIVSTFVLDYIPHSENILPQLYKLLKPGGKMWMTISADKKFYEYFKNMKEDERFAEFAKDSIEPEWIHDVNQSTACENFYKKHLISTGYKNIQMKTYPTLGLEYDTVEEYIDFFMWVGMGATSTPKSMEPTLREFCSKQVNSWITKTSNGISLDWKICNFLVEK